MTTSTIFSHQTSEVKKNSNWAS